MALHIDAGRFNRYLVWQAQVSGPDGCGGLVKSYASQGALWAHIEPVAAASKSRAGADNAVITHRIFIRKRAGLKPNDRLITGARKFVIQALFDPDETGRYLQCDVVEDQ